jgi:hypothetical protein
LIIKILIYRTPLNYNTSNSGIVSNSLRTIKTDTLGNIWTGGLGGMSKFDGSIWENFTTSNSSLPFNTVYDIEIDSDNNLWLALWGFGLVKYDYTNWIIYNQANSPIPTDLVSSVTIDQRGNKWIGTGGFGVHILGDSLESPTNNSTTSIISESACGSYVSPSGNYTWTSSNIYLDTIPNVNGYDSLMTISLLINQTYNLTDSATICNGNNYTFPDGNTLTNITNQVVYTSNFLTINYGCDSILSTILSVSPLPNVSIDDFLLDTICGNSGLVGLPMSTPSGGIYSGNGVIGGNFDPTSAGIGTHDIIYTYTDGNSCINSDTTIITVQLCTGVDNIGNDFGILIYPNPSTGQFIIEKPSNLNKEVQVKLLGVTSKVIVEKIIPADQQKV